MGGRDLGAWPALSCMVRHLLEKPPITEVDLSTDTLQRRARPDRAVGDESNVGAVRPGTVSGEQREG
jgi:hypothetical protein